MVAIRGHFDGKVIVPDDPLDLPRGQRYIVHLEPLNEQAGASLQSLVDNAIDDPSLPTDASYQHDHYLYGTPKKPSMTP